MIALTWIILYQKKKKKSRWMNDFVALHPFQQYFSRIRLIEGWTWQALCNKVVLVVVLVFTTLGHFSGHFGHGQLTYPHCSWESLLGSLPVLSAHSFTSTSYWQFPFLNQRKGENDRRNYFMTKLHERMLLEVRIKPATVHITRQTRIWSTTVPGMQWSAG